MKAVVTGVLYAVMLVVLVYIGINVYVMVTLYGASTIHDDFGASLAASRIAKVVCAAIFGLGLPYCMIGFLRHR